MSDWKNCTEPLPKVRTDPQCRMSTFAGVECVLQTWFASELASGTGRGAVGFGPRALGRGQGGGRYTTPVPGPKFSAPMRQSWSDEKWENCSRRCAVLYTMEGWCAEVEDMYVGYENYGCFGSCMNMWLLRGDAFPKLMEYRSNSELNILYFKCGIGYILRILIRSLLHLLLIYHIDIHKKKTNIL